MRSITTEQRSPVTVSMPGRYKSCRRSPSELFTKEQEQELQQCAQSDNYDKAVQDEATEKESLVKTSDVHPPKLTPLRWRSTSMKELNGSQEVAATGQPAENPIKISPVSSAQPAEELRHSQPAKRPSQAQLRAQVMNSLSKEEVNTTFQEGERVNHCQAGDPVNVPFDREHATGKEGSAYSSNPAERVNPIVRIELCSERSALNHDEKTVSPVSPIEPRKAPERRDVASGNETNGVGKRPDTPVVAPLSVDPPEEIVFQPVDLDKKYREKELVRHVTAAKIQNREEALLNNPGSPAVNGRKGLVGEEPAAMTIEFLRARLQAERSASKTVKLKMEQLSKKVVELEGRLLAEVELKRSAEVALNDALAKLKVAVAQNSPMPTSGSQKVADAGAKDIATTVQRVDLESKVELVETKTVSRGEMPLATDILQKEKKKPVATDIANDDAPATVKEDVVSKGGLWRDRSVCALPSDSVQGVDKNGGKETVARSSHDSSSGSSPERDLGPSKLKQDKRAVIEERLRSMWAKIGEDMAALAEVRGDEEPATKDATGWIAQLPSVLQEKQQSSGDSGQANGQQVESSERDSEQIEAGHTNGKMKQDSLSNKAALAEKRRSYKRNSSLAKNVAKLVEQYEFQETAQREWEENFEARQSLGHNEGEPPALVTRDGNVVTESTLDTRAKGNIARSQSQGERNQNVNGEHISRSKSLGFLPSQQGMTNRSTSRKGSSNGRIEILDDSCIEESGGDPEEIVFDPETEVAEELPNGIYLHHSREEVDSYTRGSQDALYRRGTERVGASNDMHSPRRSDRAAHHSRERFPRTDSHGEVDQQGWPVREVQDRASRDMYYEPVINNRMRVDTLYSNSDREFHHRPKSIPERMPDDMYRNGPWREVPAMDRIPRPEDRRVPGTHYPHRDHSEQKLPHTAASYRQREDGHRGMPGWQEGGDPGLRSRGMPHPSYGYPPTYGVEEPQQPPFAQPGQYGDTGGYSNRREMQYTSHGAHNSRPDYYPSGGVSGPRPPINGYPPPDRPPASQGYTDWENGGGHEDRNAPVVGTSDDGLPAGEAGEVLKALRIAKQQIKSSTGDQAAFMTAQYTVSQEHRYGAAGQVSKTSYTVEAPVGCITKTIHEGWHLEGGKSSAKRRNGLNGSNGVAIDLTGANVTELISGAGPLSVTGGESSYVEKLNVGRGIQFFFSGQ